MRDIGLLESAVLGCYQSFGNVELYPTYKEIVILSNRKYMKRLESESKRELI